MTEELKHKFEQLVADPPPPSGVPSQAVFARVRTVRRRRTAGVVTLAAAAVIAVAVAAGNLTDINSSPPVTHTPSAPVTIVTAPPTITPPPTSPTIAPSGSTTSAQVTGAAHSPNTNTPPPSNNPPPSSTSHTPDAPALGVHVSLKPTVQGLTVTMKVTLSGTELVPTDAETGKPLSTSGNDFLNLLGGTQYFFGDGEQSGSDVGAVKCVSGTDRITRHQTYTLRDETAVDPSIASTHTYAKSGTYNFKYTIKYCGADGWVPVTKTTQVTVK
jgi:hypothetical protein